MQCRQMLPIEHALPNSVDPDTDFASIGRGKCERVRDPSSARSRPPNLRVSAASRGKTARGWSPEISPLGAAVPASARRRASPTGGSAATALHGHSCHAFGCPFLPDLAASIKSSIGGCAERFRGVGQPNQRPRALWLAAVMSYAIGVPFVQSCRRGNATCVPSCPRSGLGCRRFLSQISQPAATDRARPGRGDGAKSAASWPM